MTNRSRQELAQRILRRVNPATVQYVMAMSISVNPKADLSYDDLLLGIKVVFGTQGNFGNLLKSGFRFSRKASFPSFASSDR